MSLNIEGVALLLLVAALVSMVARRFQLPYTVGLVFAGIALAFIPQTRQFVLTRELIFTLFLPPLIFEASLQIAWRALRRDLPVILILATCGVLLAAGITAAGMHFLAAWPWSSALLLGVLLSATDPVAVIAMFKETGVEGRLRLLLESESLFNDGTAAVLFSVALAGLSGGGVTPWQVSLSFFLIVFGGVLCGALVGGITLLLAGRTEDHLVEITFTTVAAYGSFLLAEHFHFSGVLATLTAGLLLGNLGPLGVLTDKGRAEVISFWEYVAFVVNSLIFLLIGTELAHQNFMSSVIPISLAVLLTLLGRAVSVYSGCLLFIRFPLRVPGADQHILFWGGLRGALALALVLGLPVSFPPRHLLILTTFAVVAFSVIVQGLTIKPLMRRLGQVAPPVKEEPVENSREAGVSPGSIHRD